VGNNTNLNDELKSCEETRNDLDAQLKETEEKVDELEGDNESLQTEIEEVERNLKATQENLTNVSENLSVCQETIDALTQNNRQLQQQLIDTQNSKTELDSENSNLKEQNLKLNQDKTNEIHTASISDHISDTKKFMVVSVIVFLSCSNILTLYMFCRNNRKVLDVRNNILDAGRRLSRQISRKMSIAHVNQMNYANMEDDDIYNLQSKTQETFGEANLGETN
jgi:DNA repair exonuclease SbcCD ATPase subunit